MRVPVLLLLLALVVMLGNGFRAEAEENDDLESRVARLEEQIAELESGLLLPGEDLTYESVGVTEARGLFLAKNRFSLACRVTPLEDALAPDVEAMWPLDKWSFMSCVRFPPTMDMQ